MFRRNAHHAFALSVGAALLGVVTLAVAGTDGSASPGQADAAAPDAAPADGSRGGHWEVPADPYVPVPPEARRSSPARQWVRDGFVSVQVNVDGQGNNIVGDAANEPSIAVGPNNPNRMVIGWRQFDTIASNFRQAGWAYSHDGGRTWTFPGTITPGVFRSDPVLDADANGNFYYNSLYAGTGFECHVFISHDGGVSWSDPIYAYGGDKQWMVIDRTGGVGHNNMYANWTRAFSDCDGQFTRSYDSGYSWQPCADVPYEPQWGTLAVGPDGELFIAGIGFFVVRSTTVQDEDLPLEWDLVAGVDMGGNPTFGDGPNPGGLLGQAYVAVDQSDGPYRGYVYYLCSVDPWGDDPLDVMFARSTDGGATWSDPVRINDDPSGTNAWQWFGTMTVAPTGRIDVIWADTRAHDPSFESELY
ncbi:MAG: sialidase family protein, partial [Planctomycetota bacterium]|nr:sialidase family protein [Planctomycetota bacterium]